MICHLDLSIFSNYLVRRMKFLCSTPRDRNHWKIYCRVALHSRVINAKSCDSPFVDYGLPIRLSNAKKQYEIIDNRKK